VSIRVTPLTLSGLGDLPAHARRCVFWEIDPAVAQQTHSFSDPHFEKEAWLSMVMLEWGSCGQVATINGKTAGCALYSPPSAVPRASLFPTSPVSPDAVLLTTLSVDDAFVADMPANSLVTAVVADLVRRGVRALEAFGIRKGVPTEMTIIDSPASQRPRATAALRCSPENCMIDAEFLEEVGFEIVAPHHRFPRLRLELDHNHGWKEDVERALDQLLAAAAAAAPTERLRRLAPAK
jgi:hypothetical protein